MTLTSDFSTADPSGRDTPRSEVVLREDWEKPEIVVEQELRAARDRRSVFALNRSPLARKIILFNLLGIVVLVAGMLYLNPFRDSLLLQRERALAFKAQLITDVLEERIASFGGTIDPSRADQALARIGLAAGLFVHIFAPDGTVLSSSSDISDNPARPVQGLVERPERIMWITDFLNRLLDYTADLITRDTGEAAPLDVQAQAQALIPEALSGATVLSRGQSPDGAIYLTVSAVDGSAGIAAVVAVSTAAGEVDDQRSRLYEVITHDVQRLDRLVSDISNASRLDADLV